MDVIKINFADFWTHFDKADNYFTKLLSKRYTIEISADPEFLIYSCYGKEHLKYDCYKIFYNGENQRTNWNACDFSLSFDYLKSENHYRLPNWFWYADPTLLLNEKTDPESILAGKSGFCNMLVSNPNATKRIDFFHKLSRYKKIDSGGKYLNNTGGPVADKLAFIKKHKFSIAFENSSYPGYTTEKIFEPMLVNSIPIYWGNPLVKKDFNTKSFINYHDYKNEEAVIERIIELDNNDAAYLSVLREPWYNANELPGCMREENIIGFFDKITSSKGKFTPVSNTNRKYFYQSTLFVQRIDQFFNRKFGYRKNFR